MADPAKTLRLIMAVIDRDVKSIKRRSKREKLSDEDADRLASYARTLHVIVDRGWRKKEEAKKKFEKMSTDDLIKALMNPKKENKNETLHVSGSEIPKPSL